METSRLIRAIYDAGAVQFGDFELSSGGKSHYYIDKYKFETKPDPLNLIATALDEKITDEKLAGVALGAVPLVTATSIKSGNPYVIARKEKKDHGTNNRIEGDLQTNEKVVVIEDVTTTGNSALDAVHALREAGAKVERVIVVVDREEGAEALLSKNGVCLESLITSDQILDVEL